MKNKPTFHCPRCVTDKPLTAVSFRQDDKGRNRRVCTDSVAYIQELEERNAAPADQRDRLQRHLQRIADEPSAA
jgi:uncharacterized protein with ATP-grasp and redox domains